MAAKKRCWTCIDRKVRCDRGFPACSSCVRSNRVCQGYGLRLSWPRDNDRKRHIVSWVPGGRHSRWSNHTHAVNVTTWDMEVYRSLCAAREVQSRPAVVPLLPSLSPTPWKRTIREQELFHYFKAVVSGSLTTFGEGPVGDLLIRIALSDNSPACVAVQKSLLALSCLLMHGPGMQADQLKLSALRALIASGGGGISRQNAVQHVAAGMTLCSFEINQRSESSNQWPSYICGAREVIKHVSAEMFTEETGLSLLVDWAYHHETLSRFSMLHWQPANPGMACKMRHAGEEAGQFLPCAPILQRNKTLRLLAQVCETVIRPSDPRSQTESYKEAIAALESQVEAADLYERPPWSSSPSEAERYAAAIAELYRIAMLIYLARATQRHRTSSPKLTRVVDKGFAILSGLDHCDRPFPVVVIGFEARDDEERRAVLEVMSNTHRMSAMRHRVECVNNLVQAFWNQTDLHSDGGVGMNYMETLIAIVSSSDVMPPFM